MGHEHRPFLMKVYDNFIDYMKYQTALKITVMAAVAIIGSTVAVNTDEFLNNCKSGLEKMMDNYYKKQLIFVLEQHHELEGSIADMPDSNLY